MLEIICTCKGNKHKSRNHSRKKLMRGAKKARAKMKKLGKIKKQLLSKEVKIVDLEKK